MQYKTLGKTGLKASILGFGILRLPEKDLKRPTVDTEESIRIIRHAIDNGVSFVDTAYNYIGTKSEKILGEALQDGYREKVIISTKSPLWDVKSKELFHSIFEEQLQKLGVDYIDIYLFHNVSKKRYDEIVKKYGLIDEMKKLKEAGKIKYFGFSSHDKPKFVKSLIDLDEFEIILLQYNFLDRENAEVYSYAKEKGLGTLVMGPIGGGRLAMEPTEEMKQWLTKNRNDFADVALKFVWSNPDIDVVLSGMGSQHMVDENITLASSEERFLTAEESKRVDTIAAKFKEIYDLDCTQCGYCDDCPSNVMIKFILKQLMVSKDPLRMHGARAKYRGIGLSKKTPGNNAEACTECGECLEKCPQNIEIIERLKEAHGILTSR
ncbi:MAG: aldo/keto reductase [Candidatus Heimdallarchaeota archaeon]